MSTIKLFPCGCQNSFVYEYGIWKNDTKCPMHKKMQHDPKQTGEEYYRDGIKSSVGIPPHVKELEDALKELNRIVPPAEFAGAQAYEIGGGCSHYVPMLQALGYKYIGVEPCDWAVNWTNAQYSNVSMLPLSIEMCSLPNASIILAAHSLEHVSDAPATLRKFYDSLNPGGTLLIVVPDDSDPVNSDHLWFFNRVSLVKILTDLGFEQVAAIEKHIVEREQFIYAIALKPK